MDNKFTYDLEQMKRAVEGKTYRLPDHINTADEFRDWIRSINLETDDNDSNSRARDS